MAPRAFRRRGRMVCGTWTGELVRKGRRLGTPRGVLWSIIGGNWFYWFCGYPLFVNITIVYWLQASEGGTLMICYCTRIMVRNWWVIGILFGIGKNCFETLLNWLIRSGWLNTSRTKPRWNRLLSASGDFMFYGKICPLSHYRYGVCIYGGIREKIGIFVRETSGSLALYLSI